MQVDPSQHATLHLYPKRGESHAGFFMRLAESLNWKSTSVAAAALGISTSDIRWGPRQRRGNSIRLSGHRLPLWAVDQNRRRVCHQCLHDDYFLREWWEINLVATCPIHKVALVDDCSCGQTLTWSDVCLSGCCTQVTNRDGLAVETSPFERWISGSLGIIKTKQAHPPWQGDLSLSASLRLLENVGALGAYGYSVHVPENSLDDTIRHVHVRRGFDILADEEFEKVLTRSIEVFRSTKGMAVPRRQLDSLGWFGDWLENEGLSADHPFAIRVVSSLEGAFRGPTRDSQIADVISIPTLASQLGLEEEEVRRRLASALGRTTLEGLFISAELATDVSNGGGERPIAPLPVSNGPGQ